MSSPTLSATQKRNILISMCTALIAVVASVSGLNVAQQDIAVDLGASQGQVLWVINAYTLALAALLMPIGAIGDRWGRKPVLLAGIAVFAGASALAAIAPSVEILIFARALAGVGAAMVMPVTLSVITSSFPAEERSQAIGIWAGFAGAGGIIGLFTSSFFVDYLTWRWLFVVPIAMMAISAAIAVRSVPNSSESGEGRFDVVGSVLSAIAIGGLVFGIHEGPEKGWDYSLTVIGLVAGVAALIGFVLWELRTEDPLLDVTAFTNRGLASGSLTITTMFAVMFGIFLVLFPFMQTILGYSALRSAAGLLPMAATMMTMSSVAPKIAAKIGSRATMMSGIAIAVTGLVTMALSASPTGGYLAILPGLLLIGFGMRTTLTPATEAITETLPAEKQGVASALNDTSRELGGAVGVALLGSIVSSGYADNIAAFASQLPGPLGDVVADDYYAALGAAEQVAQTDPQLAGQLVGAAQQAWVDGWVGSMWIGVAMASAAFVYLLVAGPKRARFVESAPAEREPINV
ncbi:MAG: DHA2 family efflux MFS transporter permease subunit [Ilumatobacter sp.]